MKELGELIRELREDRDLKQEEAVNHYIENTCPENFIVHDVMCDIEQLKPQGSKELARYLQYLKGVEEYEASRKQSRG